MEERFETFTVLLAKISRSIRKIKNLEMENYGLRSPHVSLLYYLYLHRGLTATDLCERCEEDKATISRSLTYLEENGYIVRDSNSAKRYKAPLVLTEKGKKAGARIVQKINSVIKEISNCLPEADRISFYRSLTIISNSLEAIERRIEKRLGK